MNERLALLGVWEASAVSTGDGKWGLYIPEDFRLTHISIFGTVAGGPSTATIDVQDDGVDVVAAQAISTDVLSNVADVEIAGDSVIEIDLNLVGGTTATWTGQIGLWGYWGE